MKQPKGDVRQLMEWAESVGWRRISDAKGHFRMAWGITAGVVVTIPQTPSDHRSVTNTRADMERLSGVKADRPQAAKYTHRPSDGFDMDAAVREQERRREHEARQERFRLRQKLLAEANRNGRTLTPNNLRQLTEGE